MRIKNKGQTDEEILQNRFTAYVIKSTQRCRKDYIHQIIKNIEFNSILDQFYVDEAFDLEREALSDLPLMMKIENQQLLQGIQRLGEREKYILFNRVVEAKSFEMLSLELGLTYKGVSSIYYRTIKKLKLLMNGGKNDF